MTTLLYKKEHFTFLRFSIGHSGKNDTKIHIFTNLGKKIKMMAWKAFQST